MKRNLQSYIELKSRYSNRLDIPYSELIRTTEWFERRRSILNRDGHKCSFCNKMATIDHFDSNSGKPFYFWVRGEKIESIKNELGVIEEILVPDVEFSKKQYDLHVHHKHYVLNKLPWEYEDNDLMTLCNWCHWEFHENNVVPVYRSIHEKLEQLEVIFCSRCKGAGWFPQYGHVENGVCFQCRGEKFEICNT